MIRGWPGRPRRGLAFVAACGFLAVSLAMAGAQSDTAGEAIYRHGVLPSGALLQGERDPGLHTEGATAACVNCHRRSGLGMREGGQVVQPIPGVSLFYPRAHPGDALDLPFVESMRADREPYTPAT